MTAPSQVVRRLPTVALVTAALVLPPTLLGGSFVMHLLVLSGIYAIAATGLNLVMGYSGLLSLGHHAFFGLGAYGSAIAASAGMPLLVSVAVGGLTALVAARLIGALLLKLRSAFFVIATIAFAEILRVVSLNWIEVTNGPMGIVGVPPLRVSLLGMATVDLATPARAYVLVVAVLLLVVLLVRYLVGSPMGVGLVAMRESEYVARALGIDTGRLALRSVVIGSAIAGVAGALYGHYLQFVSPDVLTFGVMITLVVMVLGGGMGTLWGPVIGAVIFTVGPEFLRASDQYRLIVYGLLIVLLVRFLPGGLWGSLRNLASRRRLRSAPTADGGDRAAMPQPQGSRQLRGTTAAEPPVEAGPQAGRTPR